MWGHSWGRRFGRRRHVRFRQSWLLLAASVSCALVTRHWSRAASTYYVAPTGGSDSNNGDIGTPFATLTKAISTAKAGDTIYARGGTYNLATNLSIGSSKVGTAANPYTLLAYAGETPI